MLVGCRPLAARHLPGIGSARGAEAAAGALEATGIDGQVLILHPDMHGLIVDGDGGPGVYDFNAAD